MNELGECSVCGKPLKRVVENGRGVWYCENPDCFMRGIRGSGEILAMVTPFGTFFVEPTLSATDGQQGEEK